MVGGPDPTPWKIQFAILHSAITEILVCLRTPLCETQISFGTPPTPWKNIMDLCMINLNVFEFKISLVRSLTTLVRCTTSDTVPLSGSCLALQGCYPRESASSGQRLRR